MIGSTCIKSYHCEKVSSHNRSSCYPTHKPRCPSLGSAPGAFSPLRRSRLRAVCPLAWRGSSISAVASSEPIDVPPPLPPKLRPKPQRKGNIGVGKLYADEAAFLADVEQHKQEQTARAEQVKERERAQERVRERGRDRSERQRVKQRRAANPNVLPPDVVDAFMWLGRGEAYKWFEDQQRFTAAAVAEGLPPPQCLMDFLDTGGSADAHPPSEHLFSRDTLLQLAADGEQTPAGPRVRVRVVQLLLQRGADVRGTLGRCSPLELATRWWYPIAKPYPDCDGCGLQGGCRHVAYATAQEKVIRLLLQAGARDSNALNRITSLTLDCAAKEVRARKPGGFEPDCCVRPGWSATRLREIQDLFRRSHRHK